MAVKLQHLGRICPDMRNQRHAGLNTRWPLPSNGPTRPGPKLPASFPPRRLRAGLHCPARPLRARAGGPARGDRGLRSAAVRCDHRALHRGREQARLRTAAAFEGPPTRHGHRRHACDLQSRPALAQCRLPAADPAQNGTLSSTVSSAEGAGVSSSSSATGNFGNSSSSCRITMLVGTRMSHGSPICSGGSSSCASSTSE